MECLISRAVFRKAFVLADWNSPEGKETQLAGCNWEELAWAEPLGLSPAIRAAKEQILDYASSVRRLDTGNRDQKYWGTFQPHPPLLIVSEPGTTQVGMITLIRKISRPTGLIIQFPPAHLNPQKAISKHMEDLQQDSTGALGLTPDYFKAAHKGLLFLPEIASLSDTEQDLLERSLVPGVGHPGYSTEAMLWPPDVVVIGSARWNVLDELVRQGMFSPSLYSMFRVFQPVVIPPLNKRPEDVLVIIKASFREYGGRWGLDDLDFSNKFSIEALELLASREYLRGEDELRRIILYLVVTKLRKDPSHEVSKADVEAAFAAEAPYTGRPDRPDPWRCICGFPQNLNLSAAENGLRKSFTEEALRRSGGKRKEAARLLGIDRHTITRIMKNDR